MAPTDSPGNWTSVKRPFWMHQAVEYILGIVLVAQGLQVPQASEATIPAVAGVLILVNAAIVRGGALSAFRLVSRATHRILDVVVIAVVALLAVQPWRSLDPGVRLIMLAIAALMGFVWWRSSFAEKVTRSHAGSERASGSGDSGGADDRSTQVGRTAGRWVGGGINAARRAAARRRGEG